MVERVPEHFERTDVARAAAGDQNAFERLYRGHVGRVYALAVRLAGVGVLLIVWGDCATCDSTSEKADATT